MKLLKEESPKTGEKKVELLIPQENVEDEYQKKLKKYSRTVQIKGFRKGKVPVKIVEMHYGEYIKAEVEENLVNNAVKEYLKNFIYYEAPSDVDFESTEEGIKVTFSFKHFPKLDDIKETFENLPYDTPGDPEISDEEINSDIHVKVLRLEIQKESTYKMLSEKVEDYKRPEKSYIKEKDDEITYGDFVEIKTQVKTADGKELSKESKDNLFIPLSDSLIEKVKEIDKNSSPANLTYKMIKSVIGKKKGDSFTIPYEIKDIYKTPDTNKEWVLNITIEKVTSFASEEDKQEAIKKYSEGKSEEEFKKAIKDEILIAEKNRLNAIVVEDVLNLLYEKYKNTEVNEDIWNNYLKSFILDKISDIAKKFYNTKPLKIEDFAKPEELKKEIEKEAHKSFWENLIIENLTRAYDIKASEDEIFRTVSMWANYLGTTPKELITELYKTGRIVNIIKDIEKTKVHNLIVEKYGIQSKKEENGGKKGE